MVSVYMKNLLYQKMKNNAFVLGPFMKLPSPDVVEIMGLAGFDYIIIDCEHGPLDMLAAQQMVCAAHLHQMGAVVRVMKNEEGLISRALDIGADAVQVPQICNAEDGRRAVRSAKFYPIGERGMCRFVRAAGYTSVPRETYFAEANRETMVIVHIEGEEGVSRIDEILAVEGIDIIFVGPYDLSQSLGVPGQVSHEKVKARMQNVIHKAKAKGKWVGTFVDDIDTALMWMREGVQYISYSVDVGLIFEKMNGIIQQFECH